ncbi:photosynthetic complex putative assembly protein PuhB [Erythrobacter sp. AP23]|uniref:photosynthetic complex putative assembly protein PuhB n=1 Tax=Erythrobacter sp. AP23 TaxID=499656 RepID=UPI00076D2B7C|nr:photosynthetic complex putative assembly protein PuhB [Erythrobacter sp. AP23]KWV94469.1 hypothetical protein ASS64_11795 [Erythrobacter sp. AP23]
MSSQHSMSQIPTLGTPQSDEKIVWQGKPDLGTLARTAFHTRAVGAYFLVLIAIALALGSIGGALLTGLAAMVTMGLLYSIAWLARRTTTYILTDRRLIMNIGMAIEKSVNLPLKRIGAAHLTDRGAGFGDIALEPTEGRSLGYAMLWPHARPLRFARPQPMLRALPDVADVAHKLAEATAAHGDIALAEPHDRKSSAPAPTGGKEALA